MERVRVVLVAFAMLITGTVIGSISQNLATADTTSADRPVMVPIEPCRIRDTRPNYGIGGRTTPVGAGEPYTVNGTGKSGDCNITSDAVGLVMNVTAVRPSEPTDIRVYPADADTPNTSNLNPTPGQPPTPNAVVTGLSGAGNFIVRNSYGTVHVIVDVTGFLIDHNHDGRYYTEAEIDAIIANNPGPQGPKGEAGPQGPKGEKGDAGVESDCDAAVTGLNLVVDGGGFATTMEVELTNTGATPAVFGEAEFWPLDATDSFVGGPQTIVLSSPFWVGYGVGEVVQPGDSVTVSLPADASMSSGLPPNTYTEFVQSRFDLFCDDRLS